MHAQALVSTCIYFTPPTFLWVNMEVHMATL